MRAWPEGWKISLRHLAAARFFLPVVLEQGEFPESEAQFNEYLHHREFGLALEILEFLGDSNRGYEEESLFWAELKLVAEHMGLMDHAARYDSKLNAASSS
jgi:hypothetical protein